MTHAASSERRSLGWHRRTEVQSHPLSLPHRVQVPPFRMVLRGVGHPSDSDGPGPVRIRNRNPGAEVGLTVPVADRMRRWKKTCRSDPGAGDMRDMSPTHTRPRQTSEPGPKQAPHDSLKGSNKAASNNRQWSRRAGTTLESNANHHATGSTCTQTVQNRPVQNRPVHPKCSYRKSYRSSV